MRNKIILVTGGARSGKSGYCQLQAEKMEGERVFVATCPAEQKSDSEMQARIARHQIEREGRGWRTVEEPLALNQVIASNNQAQVVLVDCLTLWVSNLMFAHSGENAVPLQEDNVQANCEQILLASRNCRGTIFFVSNEVGLGIVPDNPLARLYRDLVGRCNQVIASGADEVFMVHCGMPLKIK